MQSRSETPTAAAQVETIQFATGMVMTLRCAPARAPEPLPERTSEASEPPPSRNPG